MDMCLSVGVCVCVSTLLELECSIIIYLMNDKISFVLKSVM